MQRSHVASNTRRASPASLIESGACDVHQQVQYDNLLFFGVHMKYTDLQRGKDIGKGNFGIVYKVSSRFFSLLFKSFSLSLFSSSALEAICLYNLVVVFFFMFTFIFGCWSSLFTR